MTDQIPKQDWKQFFNELSKIKLGWQTKVEVLKDDIGAQILSNGLPFMGLMFEENPNVQNSFEIMLGEESGVHQTHTIFYPQKVFFESGETGENATLEIEDESGAKTIVYFVQPILVPAIYQETQIVAQF